MNIIINLYKKYGKQISSKNKRKDNQNKKNEMLKTYKIDISK